MGSCPLFLGENLRGFRGQAVCLASKCVEAGIQIQAVKLVAEFTTQNVFLVKST